MSRMMYKRAAVGFGCFGGFFCFPTASEYTQKYRAIKQDLGVRGKDLSVGSRRSEFVKQIKGLPLQILKSCLTHLSAIERADCPRRLKAKCEVLRLIIKEGMEKKDRTDVFPLSELPNDLIRRAMGMLDPGSQCIAAQASRLLKVTINDQRDAENSVITPEKRKQAARDYIQSCARDIADAVKSTRTDHGKVFEENLAQVPPAIRQDVEKRFPNELTYTIPDKIQRSMTLVAIVERLITQPGQENRAIDLANTIPDRDYKSEVLKSLGY